MRINSFLLFLIFNASSFFSVFAQEMKAIENTTEFVDKLKGKYLLVHGTGDDNVHFQNSVEMVEKMVELNKPFVSAYYPNKSHGISGGNTRLHLFTLMTNFLLENL